VENNARWRTAVMLKNWRNRDIFANCLTNFHEIWQGDESGTFATRRPLKFPEFENSRWQLAAIFKNRNIIMSP